MRLRLVLMIALLLSLLGCDGPQPHANLGFHVQCNVDKCLVFYRQPVGDDAIIKDNLTPEQAAALAKQLNEQVK